MRLLPPIEKVISCFTKLPGIGRRSAERMAIKLVSEKQANLLRDLISALQEMQNSIKQCPVCGALAVSDKEQCNFCMDVTRDRTVMCVVEDVSDVFRIESTGVFNGIYHVLSGKISPLRGEGIDSEMLNRLTAHIKNCKCKEVMLAMNMDVESDATAHFLKERLNKEGVIISRPAMGIPAGSAIAYTDSVTLGNAIKARQRLQEL